MITTSSNQSAMLRAACTGVRPPRARRTAPMLRRRATMHARSRPGTQGQHSGRAATRRCRMACASSSPIAPSRRWSASRCTCARARRSIRRNLAGLTDLTAESARQGHDDAQRAADRRGGRCARRFARHRRRLRRVAGIDQRDDAEARRGAGPARRRRAPSGLRAGRNRSRTQADARRLARRAEPAGQHRATRRGARGVSAMAPTAIPPAARRRRCRASSATDIVKLHDTYYRPDNAVLVFAGDIDLARAVQLADASVRRLESTGDGVAATRLRARARRSCASDHRHRSSRYRSGRRHRRACAVSRATRRDYYAGIVADAVLGGSYSARLNEEIRIKRGLSYGARQLAGHAPPGRLVRRQRADEESVRGRSRRSAARRIRPAGHRTAAGCDELAARKATLSGNFGFSLETTRGLLGEVAESRRVRFAARRTGALSRQGAGGDRRAGARLCQGASRPDGTSVIVAGDAKQFADALGKAYPKRERYTMAGTRSRQPHAETGAKKK